VAHDVQLVWPGVVESVHEHAAAIDRLHGRVVGRDDFDGVDLALAAEIRRFPLAQRLAVEKHDLLVRLMLAPR